MHNLLSHYSSDILEIQPVSTSYRRAAIYRVQTTHGTFALKKFRQSEAELQFVTRLLRHLEPTHYTPKIFSTREGKPYLRDGNHLFYATEWLEGTELFAPTNPVHVQRAGRILAQIHQAGRSFGLVSARRSYTGMEITVYLRRQQEFRHGFKRLLETRPASPFTRLLRDAMPKLKQETTRALKGLQSNKMTTYLASPDITHTICHRDITCPNLLVHEHTQGVTLIDFDTAGHSLPIIDLDKFLSNCLNWDFPRMKLALSAYHAVRALSEEELYLLSHLMILPKEEWHLLQLARKTQQESKLIPRLQAVLRAKEAKRQSCAMLRTLKPSDL